MKRKYRRFRKERIGRSGEIPPPRRVGDVRDAVADFYLDGEWSCEEGQDYKLGTYTTWWTEPQENTRNGFLAGNNVIVGDGYAQYSRWFANVDEGRLALYPSRLEGYDAFLTGNETEEEEAAEKDREYSWLRVGGTAWKGKVLPMGYAKVYPYRETNDEINDWHIIQITPMEDRSRLFYSKLKFWFGDELPADFPHGAINAGDL